MASKTPIALPRGVTIRESGSGPRVQIAFSWNGQECRELLPPLPISKSLIAHATSLRAEILRKIAMGQFDYANYFPGSPRARAVVDNSPRVLMHTLLKRQLSLYRSRFENGSLSPSTLEGFRKIIDGRLIPRWGTVALQDVTGAALREWIAGMDATAKTVRNVLGPLRSAFDDAIADELIASNPLDRIALDKLIRQTANASEYQVEPFDADERDAILRAATPEVARLIVFWFLTGLRTSELIGLKWDRVDRIHHRVRIDEVQVAKMAKEGAKTAAGVRDVDLSSVAWGAIEAQREASFLKGDHVWLNPRTGEPFETDQQVRKTMWAPLLKRAGVRYRVPYQCRHTYASVLLSAGANPWWLATQMGHVDIEMIMKTYGKWMPESQTRSGFARNSHGESAASLEAAPVLRLAK